MTVLATVVLILVCVAAVADIYDLSKRLSPLLMKF